MDMALETNKIKNPSMPTLGYRRDLSVKFKQSGYIDTNTSPWSLRIICTISKYVV